LLTGTKQTKQTVNTHQRNTSGTKKAIIKYIQEWCPARYHHSNMDIHL